MQYTYGILASHKKEQNWAIFSDVDESEYGTQSEVRKRKTSYINVHMWKLKKNGKGESICRNREEDIEKRLVDLGMEKVG